MNTVLETIRHIAINTVNDKVTRIVYTDIDGEIKSLSPMNMINESKYE